MQRSTGVDFNKLGRAVIETEAACVQSLSSRIGEHFVQACQLILDCQGRVIVMGMGKSGHIANKIASTLASTGTPAFFVHPAEASHGDMGMITATDVLIALSNSGETPEILNVLPLVKRLGIPLISISGNQNSRLANYATLNLDVSVDSEACPLGLAPTSSTTAALVMGDALAISLLQARGFSADDFALAHPGGQLGRKLLLRVEDIMHTGAAIPTVNERTTLSEALLEMTQKAFGMTCVMNNHGQLCGIFTDGDLRRALAAQLDIQTTPISQCMSVNPKIISKDILAAEALRIMQTYKISCVVIKATPAEDAHIQGILHMHDILRAGVA